jgi:L-fuculose-phosphate aldolase
MTESSVRKRLSEVCVRLYDRGLTVSAGGNMSVRLDDRHILITPSGMNKGLVGPGDLVKVTMSGEVVGKGKPSIETMMHLALYNGNRETNAVIHCHPLHCTVLAIRSEKMRTDLTPEGVILLGDVPMIGYFTPGTQGLVDAVAEHSQSKAILMERHGTVTQGKDLDEAYNRMEELEFQARLQILAGDVPSLPEDEIWKILGVLK